MFSRLMDYHVANRFRRDLSGRLVFLPLGPKGQAYFVDSAADEGKIRAFVKMYHSASALISLLIYPNIYVPGWIIVSFGGAISLRNKLKTDIAISLFFMLIVLTFLWMLWGVYKQGVREVTASLTEVPPEVKSQLREASPPPQRLRLALACFGAALIIMAVAILAAVRYSRPKIACPPKETATSKLSHP